MRSLKVMTWIHLDPRKLGTIEEYCYFLSRELAARGHSSLLAFSKAPPDWLKEYFHSAGAAITIIDRTVMVSTGIRLIKTVADNRVDIIHCTFLPVISGLNVFMRLSSTDKVIVSDQASRVCGTRSPIGRPIRYLRSKLLSPLIDLIIADAEYLRKSLIEDFYVSPDKIVTLYNGVNLDRFTPAQDGTAIREEFKIDPDAPVITAIAWLIFEKGLDVYLKAAPKVLEVFPRAVFLVVGDGPLLDDLKELARTLNIADHVVFTGLRNDTHKILAAADIAVLLSRWEEAFSFSMLEAMASGRPLVATTKGAIPEAVEHGKTGLLVPPEDPNAVADALIKLLDDKAALKEIGNAARRKCQDHYDIRKMVKNTVDLYESFYR